MQLSQSVRLKQKQSLVMTPQLQQAIRLLQMTNVELTDYLEDVISPVGTLAKSSAQANSSISEYTEDQAKLDEKIASMTERYMIQFSAMESAVTGFKKTGEFLTGFIDSLKPKD